MKGLPLIALLAVAGMVQAQDTTRVTGKTTADTTAHLREIELKSQSKKYKIDEPSPSLRLTSPLIGIPQNIQVISSGVLSDQQVISMSDNLIRNVSGATRLEHWGDMYTNITMRGSQIQAFRNGFNVVNSYWGPLTEDMSFVDHIEFVKGPAGFMLSNGDPSGLYNVVTKKPTGQAKGEASLTVGSFDLYRATLDLDGKLSKDGRLLYRLNLAGQNKNSFRAYEYNNRYSFAPVISYQLDGKTRLTAEYTYQAARMSDVGSFYVFGTNGYGTLPVGFTQIAPGLEPTKINDHSSFLTLDHQLNADWKLTAQASYFNYQQQGSSLWPNEVNADGTQIRSVGIWDAKSEMTLAQAFVNGNFNTGGVGHRILGGLDVGNKNYMADWGQSHALDKAGALFDDQNPNYGAPSNGYPTWDRTTPLEARAVAAGGLMDQRYTGVYLQDDLGFINNKVRLTLAGRYTYVSQSAWGGAPVSAKHVTPRIGLSVSVTPHTSLYALHDQAFVPQSGKLASGNDVKPITGSNTELGLKRDWFGGNWNTTFSVYRIMKNNELTADPNSPPTSGLSVVMGKKRAQGIEFDLRGQLFRGLNLTANYAYTDGRVTEVAPGVTGVEAGDVVPGFSKHIMNTWLNYKLQSGVLKGTGLSAGFSYQAGRTTDSWSESDVRMPDYFRLDGGVFWSKDRMNITANAFNLLDKYLYSGSYYAYLNAFYWQTEAPRSFRLSVGYKF
ncbi:TonB-dependent siderophore receptor [Hufsiella ginkgonis]|nr:TonB-dependent siderophore receptor [Hufsiella ginkgonis]